MKNLFGNNNQEPDNIKFFLSGERSQVMIWNFKIKPQRAFLLNAFINGICLASFFWFPNLAQQSKLGIWYL